MTTSKSYNIIYWTLKFCIAGFFIPGFTAAAIVGLQMAIGFWGVECTNAWTMLRTLTALGASIAPFVFVRPMNNRLSKGHNPSPRMLMIFNILEYTFLQCTLAAFFTSRETLCYVLDGQNGLEFIFTGWMAMPALLVLSFVLDALRKSKTDELKMNKVDTAS